MHEDLSLTGSTRRSALPIEVSAIELRALEHRWRCGYTQADDPIAARDSDIGALLAEVKRRRAASPARGGLLARMAQIRACRTAPGQDRDD